MPKWRNRIITPNIKDEQILLIKHGNYLLIIGFLIHITKTNGLNSECTFLKGLVNVQNVDDYLQDEVYKDICWTLLSSCLNLKCLLL